MNEIELILLLLVVAAALAPVARVLRIPYPILLVIGGLVLALLPIVPDLELTPELVFLLFLPPLVYRAAFTTSIRDFSTRLKPILSLAVGLVLATMTVVAVVFHFLLPEIGWPLAFAFGAIVSPPDAVAAAAVFRILNVPPPYPHPARRRKPHQRRYCSCSPWSSIRRGNRGPLDRRD